MALIDFTLSNARRFYSSMGNPLGWKGLKGGCIFDNFVEPRIQALNRRVQCLASLGTKIKKIFASRAVQPFSWKELRP